MKKKTALLAVGIAVLVFSGFSLWHGYVLGPEVTAQNIRKIEIGMSQDDVIRILGNPQSRRVSGIEFTYSQPNKYASWYPMLWVHFDKERVRSVYGKEYTLWGLGDEGVYLKNSERTWESDSFAGLFKGE